MKPITEYQDYRRYMQDFYEERKRTTAFTWREFAKNACFTSPSYLKLVCEGKSSLSRVGICRVAHAMNLAGFDKIYFEKLVEFGNAKTDEKKKAAFEELNRVAKEHKVRVIDADAFRYFESWVNPVVRELAPIMPGARPNEIASVCYQEATATEVRDALQFLVKSGLLQKVGEYEYQQTEKAITGSSEAIPLAIRVMHREMAEFGRKAIDRFEVEERNITGVTMGLNEETYERIVKEIDSCRKRIIAIANECKNVDQVYRLNLQMFPLTKKVQVQEVDYVK